MTRFERFGFDDQVCAELERLAGQDSELARRHHMYLDLVRRSMPFLPGAPRTCACRS